MSFGLPRWLALGLAGAGALMLGGCYNDGYGYGGVSVGVGSGYVGGYGPYGYADPYYGGFGYGGYPAYGWYDGFYYPGNGFYVYDRGGRRFRMRDRDRQYWAGRGRDGRPGNWRGDGRPGDGRPGNWRGDGRPGNWRGPDGAPSAGVRPPNGRPDGEGAARWQQRNGGSTQGWAGRREAWRNNMTPQENRNLQGLRGPLGRSFQSPGGGGGQRSFTPRSGGTGSPMTRGRSRSR